MSDTRTLLLLLGFTPFERRSFQAFFEHAREHGPGYDFTDDPWRAQCAVADADDEEAMARLLHAGKLVERAVLLGNTPHRGAALQLPRPINLFLVMRALDTLTGARPRPGARLASSADEPPPRRAAPRLVVLPDTPELVPPEPARDGERDAPPDSSAGVFTALSGHSISSTPMPRRAATAAAADASGSGAEAAPPAPGSPQVQRVLDELAFRTATLPAGVDVRALAAQGAPSAARSGQRARQDRPDGSRARARHAPLPMEHILVIDHDAATLRLIAVQLQRFGFQIHLAGHPDDAMRLLTQRFHEYVFMDPALPGLDALLICRLARQIPAPDDGCATTVVLLADPATPAAPLQRALPAADACLKKPVDQQALLRLVGEREVARVAFADTARTTTLI